MRSSRWPLRPSHRLPFRAGLIWALVWLIVPAVVHPVAAQDTPASASSSVASSLRDAERAYRRGEYDSVIDLLGPAPASGDAVVLASRADAARGRYDRAIARLTPAAGRERTGDAAVELGALLLSVGRHDEAVRWLTGVLEGNRRSEDDRGLARAAIAARWLGRFQEANDLYRDAVVLGGDDPAVQTGWGDLLLEKHNSADAARSYRQALQIDRTYAPALLGLARILSDTNPPAGSDLVARALRLNPSLVPALVFRAELALDDDDVETARQALASALEVNPASVDALSLEAAIAFLEDRTDDFETTVQRVLAVNPKYGGVYRVVSDHAARHYRFEEAVDLARKALALDAADPRSHAALGMHLLRTGDETAARAALEKAFTDDPYDVVTYNLLGLLDTLDKFVTVEDGPLVLRFHADEAPVLREHAVPLARDALSTLAARYGVAPQHPILVEIFPRHDDFAVRTLGLPGMIGALGACFGRVVTLDSPRARPPGTFSWEATLWHEMAHVVTLQLSRQRVPRWLTEGISVYEEQEARPEWGREMRVRFAEALDDGEVISIADLPKAFGNPETIALAYYEASLVVRHIVDTYGMERLKAMLRAYGDGLDTEQAAQRALGVGVPQLQDGFMRAVDRDFSHLRTALAPPPAGELAAAVDQEALEALARKYPGSYPVWMALAQAQEDADDGAAALASFRKAAQLVPEATGQEGPRAHIIAAALKSGDRALAAEMLKQTIAADPTNIDAARQLLTVIDPVADRDSTLEAQSVIAELDPFDAAAQTALGRDALDRGDAKRAARLFRAAVAAGPNDRVGAYCDLAEAYWRLGEADSAKRQTLAALELAPSYARAQDLLLTIVEARP